MSYFLIVPGKLRYREGPPANRQLWGFTQDYCYPGLQAWQYIAVFCWILLDIAWPVNSTKTLCRLLHLPSLLPMFTDISQECLRGLCFIRVLTCNRMYWAKKHILFSLAFNLSTYTTRNFWSRKNREILSDWEVISLLRVGSELLLVVRVMTIFFSANSILIKKKSLNRNMRCLEKHIMRWGVEDKTSLIIVQTLTNKGPTLSRFAEVASISICYPSLLVSF
jgi:hypothetical protein